MQANPKVVALPMTAWRQEAGAMAGASAMAAYIGSSLPEDSPVRYALMTEAKWWANCALIRGIEAVV
jgi:hypothetical protein